MAVSNGVAHGIAHKGHWRVTDSHDSSHTHKLYDSFDDVNGTGVASHEPDLFADRTWIVQGGAPVIQDNLLQGPGYWEAVCDVGVTGTQLIAQGFVAGAVSSADWGLLLRSISSTSGYYLTLYTPDLVAVKPALELYEWTSPTHALRASGGQTSEKIVVDHIITVVDTGSLIKAYTDKGALLSYSSTDKNDSTRVGVYAETNPHYARVRRMRVFK